MVDDILKLLDKGYEITMGPSNAFDIYNIYIRFGNKRVSGTISLYELKSFKGSYKQLLMWRIYEMIGKLDEM